MRARNPQLQYEISRILADTQILQFCKVCCRCYCGCRCQLLPCQSCLVLYRTVLVLVSYLSAASLVRYDLCIIFQSAAEQSFAVADRPMVCFRTRDPKQFSPQKHTVGISIQHSQLPHYCILFGICRKIAIGRDMATGMSPTVLRRCRYRLLLHPLIYTACRNRHSPVCYG